MDPHINHGLSNGKRYHVAIIGGGASGTLSAIQLLQLKLPILVHVFNEGFEVGRGVAYSAACNRLVLNVPARNMSAFPDRPDHFIGWLKERYGNLYTSDSFVPRHIYGDYLQDILQTGLKNAPAAQLQLYDSRITKLLPQERGYAIVHGKKETFAHAVILALGNPPPADLKLPSEKSIGDPRYICDPWKEAGNIAEICGDGTVVILGSGLTALDMILQLRQQKYSGNIVLISRRGQWPSVHRPGLVSADDASLAWKGLSPCQILRALRQKVQLVEGQGGDWRQVIDALRTNTNDIWAGWTFRQRQSFIRHLQPYWNVHRHRVSPDAWDSLSQEIKTGATQLKAGRIVEIRPDRNGLTVAYRPRRQGCEQELQARFVINCTGSDTLHGECRQALIQFLLDQSLGQLDPLGHGLATTPDGAVLNANGQAVQGLYTIGPLRRGTLWETTAIREIRVQATVIAQVISRHLTALSDPSRHGDDVESVGI
jgi:uncharacterized NAD(P)/FAD-binding protein YdhS